MGSFLNLRLQIHVLDKQLSLQGFVLLQLPLEFVHQPGVVESEGGMGSELLDHRHDPSLHMGPGSTMLHGHDPQTVTAGQEQRDDEEVAGSGEERVKPGIPFWIDRVHQQGLASVPGPLHDWVESTIHSRGLTRSPVRHQ